MTDTSKDELDALDKKLRRGAYLADLELQVEAANTIWVLRRERDEARVSDEARKYVVKSLRARLDAARTVTREQVDKIWEKIAYIDDQDASGAPLVISKDTFECALYDLGLTITDSADSEGRQCDCPEVQAHGRGNVWHFACRKSDRVLVTRRCTIKGDGK